MCTLRTKALRAILGGFAAAYLITEALGAPAVQSKYTQSEIETYKRLRDERGSGVRPVHPRLKTTVAFPLLPGVIVLHHEYSLAGLYGWGGWSVYLWYGTGIKHLLDITDWVS